MDTIVAIIAAAGVPSAILGFLIRRLEKRIDEDKKAKEEQERERANSTKPSRCRC